MANENIPNKEDPGYESENHEPPEIIALGEGLDVESDPALSDEVGQDWTDEGGATAEGPATSSS